MSSAARVERGVLRGVGRARGDEGRTVRADLEQLGPAIECEQQPARPARTRGELPVDVFEVGPAHDGDEHALFAQGLDQRADRARVGAPVRDGGAVPVEDDRFESAGEERGAQDFERRFTTCAVDPG